MQRRSKVLVLVIIRSYHGQSRSSHSFLRNILILTQLLRSMRRSSRFASPPEDLESSEICPFPPAREANRRTEPCRDSTWRCRSLPQRPGRAGFGRGSAYNLSAGTS